MSSEHTHPSFLWSVVQAASTHILALTAKIHEREAFFSNILTRSQQILPNSLEIQKEVVLVIISIIKTSILLFYLHLFGTRQGFRELLYTTQVLVIIWCWGFSPRHS